MTKRKIKNEVLKELEKYGNFHCLKNWAIIEEAIDLTIKETRKATAKEIFKELNKRGFYNLICNYYDEKELKELKKKFGVE